MTCTNKPEDYADTILKAMSDQELRDAANQCELDLIEAATLAPQSERHGECFAALYCLCTEMTARGMTFKPVGVFQ